MRKILLILICIFLGSTYAYTIDITTHYLGTGATYWNLPDTGQTTSYDTGDYDDAMYQPADSQPNYTAKTISGGDVVIDNRTGLMWVQDTENDLPSPWPGIMDWKDALSACEGLTFAGYSDWRLPNAKELFSIVEQEGSKPFIKEPPFQNTTDFYYWTSTTSTPYPGSAMILDFEYGYLLRCSKSQTEYVRPVRGGL